MSTSVPSQSNPCKPVGARNPRHPTAASRLLALVLGLSAPALPLPAATDGPAASFGTASPHGDGAAPDTGAALERAQLFLTKQQRDDGSWRSDHYGHLADGASLTAHVAVQMRRSDRLDADRHAAAVDFVLRHNGGAPPVNEPIHTTALVLELLAGVNTPAAETARQRRFERLANRRLAGPGGQRADHPDHGGWSYALIDPPAPGPDQRQGPGPFSANLSATRFAIDALHMPGDRLPPGATAEIRAEWSAAAATLALRCQNTPERGPADSTGIDGRPIVFNDGGFFFSPTDPALNKAGALATDHQRQPRFHSYGSATCDALLLLLHAGHDRDHPAVEAGMHWLRQRVGDDLPARSVHPGRFAADREPLRHSYDYYFLNGAARLLHEWDRRFGLEEWQLTWAGRCRDLLLERQQADGSWRNAFSDGSEDDPLVATPMALNALARLHQIVGSQHAGAGRDSLGGADTGTIAMGRHRTSGTEVLLVLQHQARPVRTAR